MQKYKLAIAIPVFNDWISLNILLKNIKLELNKSTLIDSYCIIIINDASNIECSILEDINNENLFFVNLKNNLGHQRAIACGMCFIKDNILCDNIIIMDSDGEDNPEYIEKLFLLSIKQNNIVFASRTKRQESLIFKLFYKIYKIAFKVLTGKSIYFGNFSSIPFSIVEKLVYNENLWNNYTATILKSKLPFTTIPTVRGKRYDGMSQMTLSTLIIHGFSSISVLMDIMSIRIIMFSFATILISFISILTVFAIKLFTNYAIPGWASFTILILLNILFQSLMIAILMLFIYLSKRTSKNIIPFDDYKSFIF